jgi:ubiquitin C-terminal hydrolase
MNTAFQCLLSIPELNFHFSTSQYESFSNKNHPISNSFKDLINSYNDNSNFPLQPPKTIFQTSSKFLSLSSQQDSQEFLRRFLGGIQDELNHKKKYIFPDNISMNSAWKIYRQNNPCFIDSIFSGLICSRIKCLKCKKISFTFDPILDLSLSVNNNKNKEKLNECLNEYFKEEIINDKDGVCEKCNKKNIKIVKKMDFVILPPILTIHIKRFEGNGEKINTKIGFKSELDLEKFVYKENFNNENNDENDDFDVNNKFVKYRLFATVVHQGNSIRGGHYFAVVNRNEEWFVCDDESVKKCSEKASLNPDCYLLFYRQIQN